jgi:hypothetical protein
MHFRWMPIVFLLTASCGLKVGEKPPPNAEISTSGARYSCVGKIAQRTMDYLDDKMSDQEVTAFIGCLQNAFLMFSERFHGEKQRDVFSPDEMRRFIQEKFLHNDRVISDKLLHQFMVIKNNLLGGGINSIRRSDLRTAVGVLEKLKVEALRLRPFIPILNSKLVEFQSAGELEAKISEADRALQTSVETIAHLLAGSQTPYSFDDFEVFLDEFRSFTKWKEHVENSRSPQAWVQFLKAFKSMSVSPNPDVVLPTEWVPLLRASYRWYLNFILYETGVKNKAILQRDGFKNFIKLSDNLQQLLFDAVSVQPKRIITFEQIDRMVDALKALDWLPQTMQSESVKVALHAFIGKILGPENVISGSRSSADVSKGMDTLTLANFAAQFAQWEQIQLALQEKYSDSQIPREPMNASVPLFNIPLQIGKAPFDRSGWQKFIATFQEGRVLYKEGFDRVFLIEQPRLRDFNVVNGFYNLSRMNLIRALLVLIYRGYYYETGNSPINGVKSSPVKVAVDNCRRLLPVPSVAEWEKCLNGAIEVNPSYPSSLGLSKEALQAFYEDFYLFGADLGILDRRVHDAGARTFGEAKVFTYSADGIDDGPHRLLTFSQAIEESSYIFSAGALASDLYKRFSALCPKGFLLDQNNAFKLERTCVRNNLVHELIDLIKTMPFYTKYLESLDQDRARAYADSLLTSAFSKFSRLDPDVVERSELATVSMVIHYAETLMTNYNTDLDDYLSEEEVIKAQPIFRGYIKAIAKKKHISIPTDGFADNAFMFILAKGRLPSSEKDNDDVIRHWALGWAGMKWGIKMDRSDIAKVFSMIIQKISGTDAEEDVVPIRHPCIRGDTYICPDD